MKTIICTIFLLVSIVPGSMAQERTAYTYLGVRPSRLASSVFLVSEQVEIELGQEQCWFNGNYQFSSMATSNQILKLGLASTAPEMIQNPEVQVDSQAIHLKRSSEERLIIEDKGEYEFSHLEKIYWLLWKMDFEPSQQRIVDVRYAVISKAGSGTKGSNYLQFKPMIVHEFQTKAWGITPEVQIVLDGLQSEFSGYRIPGYEKWNNNPVALVHVSDTAPFVRGASFPGVQSVEGWRWRLEGREHRTLEIEYNPMLTLEVESNNVEKALRRYPQSESLSQLSTFLETLTLKELVPNNNTHSEYRTGTFAASMQN
ncbi:MAG: hypothetical protein KKB70_09945 [Proteobacteria bacterium]|nr:hypothetical protein [Pseudomonadota bacterium]MBU1536853.1 hypothetical protein [Myxococcota bacterium]